MAHHTQTRPVNKESVGALVEEQHRQQPYSFVSKHARDTICAQDYRSNLRRCKLALASDTASIPVKEIPGGYQFNKDT